MALSVSARSRLPSTRRVARYGAVAICVLALAVGGLWLGLRLAGPVSKPTRLGVVALKVSPALHGNIDVFIPIANWGIRAHAWSAPIQLHVEPRSANRQSVIRAAAGNTHILQHARADASDAARDALVRALVWGIGGAALLGAAAGIVAVARGHRHGWWHALAWVAASALVAAAIGGGVLLRARATFDATAFEHPRFYARGAELAQLLKVAENAQAKGLGYTSEIDRTLSSYASLLQAGGRLDRVPATAPALVMSDLHGNTLVLPALRRLARGAGPIFFVGDFGQAGTDAEARLLVRRVTDLGRPLIAVSGNHDSSLMMRALNVAGAIVLTENGRLRANGRPDGKPVQRINGLLVAGYSDPLESRDGKPNDPGRIFSFAELPDGKAQYAVAQQRIIDWFHSLPERPEVVLIHENGLAQGLARAVAADPVGPPLLILTGHDHEQHVDVYRNNVLVVDAGTVGAGGIFGAGRASIGIAQLHFGGAGASALRAIDMVDVEPISGSAHADRVVVGSPAACKTHGVVCHEGV